MFQHGHVVREVYLKVRDLSRSIQFYSNLLNVEPYMNVSTASFQLVGSRLILLERPDAHQEPLGSPGLYHVAYTVNTLEGLNEVYRRTLEHNYRLLGGADHGYTYALYLTDPDGNGVEIYWDKDFYDGPLKTSPLYMDSLLEFGYDEGYRTSIGHIHIKVESLEVAEKFFQGKLSMDVTSREYYGALFFSYGGYHHHIGANIWETMHIKSSRKVGYEYIGLEGYSLKPPKNFPVKKGRYIDPAGHLVNII